MAWSTFSLVSIENLSGTAILKNLFQFFSLRQIEGQFNWIA